MIFKQLDVNYTSDVASIIPCLSTSAQSISLRFNENIDTLIDSELYDSTKSITDQLTIRLGYRVIISVTVLKQLLHIYPNVKRVILLCSVDSKIEGAWPSTHYTNLRSFNDKWGKVFESKMIPLSLNGYQELECKPELMIRGIQDAKF